MYPPRVKMTVGMKNLDDRNSYKLLVKIEGCSKEDQLDIQLFFPPCIVFSITYYRHMHIYALILCVLMLRLIMIQIYGLEASS